MVSPSARVEVVALPGIPEVTAGSDVASFIADGIRSLGIELREDDVIVVTQKVVSKAEGRVVPAKDEAAKRRVVEGEAMRIVRRRGDLIIAQTSHGLVCANAGVDSSNVDDGFVSLLPVDPDRSARRLRKQLARSLGATPAVVISDTFGRAWRGGQTNVAIGIAGMLPFNDYRGSMDSFGRRLHATVIAVADEVAAAAELVMGKSQGVPAALVRGVLFRPGRGRAAALIRRPADDLFR